MPRPTKLDKENFIRAYAQTGSILGAARKAGINRQTVYRGFERDPEFRDTAKQTCNETEARRGGHEYREFLRALRTLSSTFPRFRGFVQETREEFVFRFDGLRDHQYSKVVAAIRLGFCDLRGIEDETHIPARQLKEVLKEMVSRGEIRREKEERVGNQSGRTKWLYRECR